ncbi:phosphatase PAP2 family protein [Thiotrichales bacterium 19S3-7]|nr:phosphatase PAP2 family protein [Thiotrichales bacterium 19S3-7]MCF6801557.1 phosphatase PAP2 family protein [Thiotrichales bacterium 19S3-11]
MAGIPLAPHPVIDPYLVKVDSFFHFNIKYIIQLSNQFSMVNTLFNDTYLSIEFACILTLGLLPLINWQSYKNLTFMFFNLMTITFIFCYFFPSVGPAYSYHNIKFSNTATDLAASYINLRNNPILSSPSSCISCPSWHVIIALLITISWWPTKKFYIRYFILGYCSLLIFSVFPTGMHYLTDVIASFILVAITYFITYKLFPKVKHYDFVVPLAFLELLLATKKTAIYKKLCNTIFNFRCRQ